MKTLRDTRPKEEQKEKRKPYDEKHEIKQRFSREEASTCVIQKQNRKMKKDNQEIKTINIFIFSPNLHGNRTKRETKTI